MKRILLPILLVLAVLQLPAQDLPHFKRVVRELSSAKYQGRGYARDGANDNASGTAAIVTLERIKYLFNLDMIGDDNPVQYCEVSDAGMAQFPGERRRLGLSPLPHSGGQHEDGPLREL